MFEIKNLHHLYYDYLLGTLVRTERAGIGGVSFVTW